MEMVELFILSLLWLTEVNCDIHQRNKTSNVTMRSFMEKYLLTDRYTGYVRPGVDEGEPTNVKTDMYVGSISGINEINMEFSMNIFFRQRWRDKRLQFTEYDDYVILDYSLYGLLWIPDTQFDNLKDGHFKDITVPNRLIYLYPDGQIYYSQGLSLRLDCFMDLSNFPMDTQKCTSMFGSFAYTERDLTIEWRDISNPIQMTNNLTLAEFELVDVQNKTCKNNYITGPFSCLYVEFTFKRKFIYYLVQIYVPSTLVVILSWVAFWIDADAVPARVSLGLLTVLTMTTQISSMKSQQPRVSYIKALDVWMSTCLVFVFGSLLQYSVVNVFFRREEKMIKNKKLEHSILTSDSCEIFIFRKDSRTGNGYMSGPGRHFDTSSTAEMSTSDTSLSSPQLKSSKSCPCFKMKYHQRRSTRVDAISRFLFPVVFVFFNAGYWLTYKWILQP